MDILYSLDWYDGPRSGVADYNGQPHFFESQWADIGTADEDWFKLSPITKEVFEQEIELWGLWKKWKAAYDAGLTEQEYHPFLPADRLRGEELEELQKTQLKLDEESYLIAQADFVSIKQVLPHAADAEMMVEWTILSEPPTPDR